MRHSTHHKTVIVDFGRGSIKMALAESACEAVRFHGITTIPFPRGTEETETVDAKALAESIRAEVQRRGWKGMRAAVLLSGSATSTQSFLFPPMPEADLRRAIALKLEDTLHFDVKEAFFDFRRLDEDEVSENEPTMTLVSVAKIEEIRKGVAVMRQAGLKPVAIGDAPESLANLLQCTSLWDSNEASIHVDVGSDTTILNLFEGTLLRFSREVEIAGSAFTAALLRPIITSHGPIQLSEAQAQELQEIAGYPSDDDPTLLPHGILASDILPLMEPVAQRLCAEIDRSIDYLCGLLGRRKVERIVLSGSAGRMHRLDRYLEENLETKVIYSDPVARAMTHWRLAICDEEAPDLAGFSAILGYALGNRRPINLLPREETLAQMGERISHLRRAVIPPVTAAGLCLALVGVPITRTYGDARELMKTTSSQLDTRLRTRAVTAARHERAGEVTQELWTARGLVADWVGILKELSAILPDEMQLTTIESESSNGVPILHLSATIRAGESPIDEVSTRMTMRLATSPYFSGVHVIDASIVEDGSVGRYEVTMDIVAAVHGPQEQGS